MLFSIVLAVFSSFILIVVGSLQFYFIRKIPVEKTGATAIAELISDSLKAYLKRLFSGIMQILLYVTLVLLVFTFVFETPFSWIQILAFFIGGSLMSLISYLILSVCPSLIPRTIQKSKAYFHEGLLTLFSSCSSLGFMSVGAMILGFSLSYWLLGSSSVIGFGLGVILASFFLRIGGSLYKTGCDIGSQTAVRMAREIPSFDARNPGAILECGSNYIAQIVGFGSDILGSFIFALISSLLLATTLTDSEKLSSLTFFILSIGLFISLLTYFFCYIRIKTRKTANFLLEGIYIAVISCGLLTWFVVSRLNSEWDLMPLWGTHRFMPFYPYLFGLLGAALICFSSEYMTSFRYPFAKKIASHAEYGTVLSLINGNGVGMKSNGLFLIFMICVLSFSFFFSGVYGIAMASLGMLSVTCFILIAKLFSPMAHTVSSIAKLSDSPGASIKNLYQMDKIGMTTIALGNGFASSASVMTTLSLLLSIIFLVKIDISQLLLVDLKLLFGIIIGITLPFVFSGFLLQGLDKCVLAGFREILRQFREIPYLIQNKAKPDMTKASDTLSCVSMDALIIPGIIMGVVPISIGYIIGIKCLFGVALGTFLTGFNQGFFWANLGDALHHAKRYIENGSYGGKESPTYQNILTADNIGSLYKDLLSPSINIVIKAVTIISTLVIVLLSSH